MTTARELLLAIADKLDAARPGASLEATVPACRAVVALFPPEVGREAFAMMVFSLDYERLVALINASPADLAREMRSLAREEHPPPRLIEFLLSITDGRPPP